MIATRISTLLAVVLTAMVALTIPTRAADITPAEARAIAREAYIYGFPMVDNYRIQYAYFVDKQGPEYKLPWNQLLNIPRVYTPEDKAIQTPNSDTPYSMVGMDLRAEPIVLTVPVIEKERYFSIQLIDAYTHNFDYIGSRATGNDGGSFLIAGPNWKGDPPKGVKKVIRSETEFVFAVYRTQLFNPGDLDNVKKVQAGYKAQPLSAFLAQPAPKAAPAIVFIKPLTPAEQKTSLEFFNILNFILKFTPTVPSETALMERFAKIGVGAGKTFDASKLTPEVKQAIEQGVADAWKEFNEFKSTQVDAGKVTSGDIFGTREYLKNNYLYRMTAAILGIYGNSKAEAMYPFYSVDAAGEKLDATKNCYTLRFAPGQLPPVNAFWSVTMYDLPASLLVANPLNRYLLNAPMLPQFKKDADGGLTLYIQNESPGKDKEANWLPAPKGPFFMAMRLYWPKEEAMEGKWTAPPLKRLDKGTVVDMKTDSKTIFVAGMPSNGSADLAGTSWLVKDIAGVAVTSNTHSTVSFDKSGRVSGSTACNSFNGPAAITGSELKFGTFATTRKACEPEVMDQEHRFLEAMDSVRNYSLDANGSLHLKGANGESLLQLSRVER